MIATAFSMTAKTVRLIYKRMKERELLGTTMIPDILGRPWSITTEIEEVVTYLIAKVPYIYQDEIADFLYNVYEIRVSQLIVLRLLQRIELTRKQLSVQPKERNSELRGDY